MLKNRTWICVGLHNHRPKFVCISTTQHIKNTANLLCTSKEVTHQNLWEVLSSKQVQTKNTLSACSIQQGVNEVHRMQSYYMLSRLLWSELPRQLTAILQLCGCLLNESPKFTLPLVLFCFPTTHEKNVWLISC